MPQDRGRIPASVSPWPAPLPEVMEDAGPAAQLPARVPAVCGRQQPASQETVPRWADGWTSSLGPEQDGCVCSPGRQGPHPQEVERLCAPVQPRLPPASPTLAVSASPGYWPVSTREQKRGGGNSNSSRKTNLRSHGYCPPSLHLDSPWDRKLPPPHVGTLRSEEQEESILVQGEEVKTQDEFPILDSVLQSLIGLFTICYCLPSERRE